MTPTSRRGLFAVLLACVGCAADSGEATQSVTAPEVFGLYHVPGLVDSVSLELREGSFRWSFYGCDTFATGSGQLQVQRERPLLLSLTDAERDFEWPGSPRSRRTREVRLEVAGENLIEVDTRQRWEPGGVCAICRGPFGPSGQEPCDHPYSFD